MTNRRHRPLRLLLVVTAGLTACGSSGSTTATPTAGAEETRSAQQIYDDFLTAMAKEQSVHIAGHQVDSTGSNSASTSSTPRTLRASPSPRGGRRSTWW